MKYARRSSTESYQMWGLLILNKLMRILLQIDTDHSETIDFNEFVKIMTWSVLIMRIKRKTLSWNLYWLWLWVITVWYHIMEYWADHLSPSSTCRCDAAADLTLEVSWTIYLSKCQHQAGQRTTYNSRRGRRRMVLGLYKVVRGWLVWKLCKV